MTSGLLTWVPRPVHADAVERLREAGEVALGFGDDAVPYAVVADRVTGVLLRTATFGRAEIEAAPRLRVIARHGVGVDTVDLVAASEGGVPVTIAAEANAQAVAEHVFALLLAVTRQVVAADDAVRAGAWTTARPALVGSELSGRRLGLLGCGRIGRRVARIAHAFGMSVRVCDPAVDDAEAVTLGVQPVSRDVLLATSDVLSLHLPLTPETRGIVDAAAIAALPRGAILVNTARGALVDEDALVRALESGQLGGAGLDVVAEEPLLPRDPLACAPGLVLSPHIGGQTAESLRRVALQAAESICDAYAGRSLRHVVNEPR